MENLFFELLQVAIGNKTSLSTVPSKEEWSFLSQMAQKQSLVGIAFSGVQKLPVEQRPERSIILNWFVFATQLQQRNTLTTEVCNLLYQQLQEEGYCSCILKGQANHRYYDNELRNLRACGDIDIWVAPQDKGQKHPVRKVLEYYMRKCTVESLCYLHIELKPIRSVPVEVHLRPSFMNAPIRNRRFQKLFGHGAERFDEIVTIKEVDGVAMPVMKVDYDVIFQLNHLYRHLIDEGVGLRQVLDYYMLLRTWNNEHEMSKEMLLSHIKRLGMFRFAKALMYVLQEVFAMPADWMICTPSEKDGRFLLDEILQSGNFGQYDPRMAHLNVQKGKTSYQVQRAWRRITRNARFITSYPEEVIWEPIARVEHFVWRKLKLWRW